MLHQSKLKLMLEMSCFFDESDGRRRISSIWDCSNRENGSSDCCGLTFCLMFTKGRGGNLSGTRKPRSGKIWGCRTSASLVCWVFDNVDFWAVGVIVDCVLSKTDSVVPVDKFETDLMPKENFFCCRNCSNCSVRCFCFCNCCACSNCCCCFCMEMLGIWPYA